MEKTLPDKNLPKSIKRKAFKLAENEGFEGIVEILEREGHQWQETDQTMLKMTVERLIVKGKEDSVSEPTKWVNSQFRYSAGLAFIRFIVRDEIAKQEETLQKTRQEGGNMKIEEQEQKLLKWKSYMETQRTEDPGPSKEEED